MNLHTIFNMTHQKYTIFVFLACLTSAVFSQALFNNNGATITLKPGALVIVKTNSVDNIAGNIHVENTAQFIIEQDLINNASTKNAGYYQIQRDFINNATATGYNTNTGMYEVWRNWENNATFTAHQSSARLNGLAPQLITGSQVTNFYNLYLENATLKTQTLNSFTTNLLNLNDCELATDVFNMSVTNPATAAIQRTSGFVSSLGSGQLERYTNSVAYYLFPVGSSLGTARYRPIDLQPSNANANNHFGVRLANVNATTEGYNIATKETEICDINPNFYHKIYRNQGNATANLIMYYDPVTDALWETAAHWQNVPQWEKIPAATLGAAAGFSTISWNQWNNFTTPSFVLANLSPIIDTSNIKIIAEYCGPSGEISGIAIVNDLIGSTYTWTNAAGAVLGNDPTFLTGLTSGFYTLTVNKPTGCSATMTFFVPFVPTFTYTLTGADVKCFGQNTGNIDLQITGGFNPYNYSWSNGTTTQDLHNVGIGTYIVVINDGKGCQQTDTITINQPPALEIDRSFTPETCEQANGTATVAVSGGVPPYTYSWNTTPPQTTTTISNLVANLYGIVATDANGCRIGTSINVPNIATPEALFTADAEINTDILLSQADIQFNNLSTGAVAYSWDFGDGEQGNGRNPHHIYHEAGAYIVTLVAFNSVGCSSIYVLGPFIIVPDGALYIPNAFTPNRDGNNDFFLCIGEGVEDFKMIIFDRWGREITVLNSIVESWDGTSKGQPAPEGVYTYVVNARLNNGNTLKRGGTITLLR